MGVTAATELVFTILPPRCARITGSTARVTRTMPQKLTSSWRWASSTDVNSAAPEMPNPALLSSMSMRPSAARTAWTAAATDASSVTSAVTWRTDAQPLFSCRENSYTVQPCAARYAAAAAPMPELPPVTIATCPMGRILLYELNS